MATKKGRCAVVKWVIIIVLMITPAVLSLLFIKEYGVNVPFWDQFHFIPLLDKMFSGHLSFADLFAQHNEHRTPFAWLTMLLLGSITHYNNVAEMYFSWFLLCLTSCVLLSVYIRNFGTSQGALAKFIPVVWLIFSLRQWESLLWGITLSIFMMVLFFVLSVYSLEKSRNIGGWFVLSIVSGVICSFTFANGLLIWPIGFIQILWTWWSQRKEYKWSYSKMISVWCLMGILVYIAYFVGYVQPSHHPSLLYFMHHPFSSASFLMVCIGSPLAVDIYTAAAMGILLLASYIYVLVYAIKRDSQTRSVMTFPLSLVSFSLLTAAILVLARSGFGVEQALSSRYTTLIAPGIVGLYLLILQLKVKYQNLKPFLFGFVLSLMALGIVASYGRAIMSDGKSIRAYRNEAAYYLTTFEIQSDNNLALLFKDPQFVREQAEALKKYKLNVFASPRFGLEKLALAEGTTLFYIDTINGRPPAQQDYRIIIDVQQEKTIAVSGWAVDQKAGVAAGGVFITVDGQEDIPAFYGVDRPDVAASYQNSHYRFSGFLASFPVSTLGDGQHTLSLKIVTADISGYYVSEQIIILEVR